MPCSHWRNGTFEESRVATERISGMDCTIKVYPGEDELQSLSDGVFRVLSGEEQPKTLPPGSLASDALTI